MQVRLQAKALRLSAIELKTHSVIVTLDAKSRVSSQAIHRMMDRYKKRVCFLSPLSFELQMPASRLAFHLSRTHRNLAKPGRL